MRFVIILFLSIFFGNYHAFAQKDTLKVNAVLRTSTNYKSYVIVNDDLFAINDSGKVVIWDLTRLDTVGFLFNSAKTIYTAIAKDQKNNVFLATKDGSVFKINPGDLSCSLILKIKYKIYGIAINPSGKILLIARGIYDPVSTKYWDQFENHASGMITFKTKRTFIFFHKKVIVTKHFAMPQYSFVDSEGKWWMIAVYGEFGGELEIFDTQNQVIVNNKFDGIDPGNLSPRSVFEDDKKNIYITCGLQHMMNFGEIYKIDKNRSVKKIFDGVINSNDQAKKNAFDRSDFVGPGVFNTFDKNIYFATSSGFYKADPNENKITPKFLFNAKFKWSREPLAVGVTMSILKIDFTAHNDLLFLTQNDGFGLYDGKKLTMFK